jgi:hypothetical protein
MYFFNFFTIFVYSCLAGKRAASRAFLPSLTKKQAVLLNSGSSGFSVRPFEVMNKDEHCTTIHLNPCMYI